MVGYGGIWMIHDDSGRFQAGFFMFLGPGW